MTIDTSKEAVERLLIGVTPGPWRSKWPFSYGDRDPRYVAACDIAGEDASVCMLREDQISDAEFIAAARELVPALAAERDAQTARADAAEAREKALLSTYDGERKAMVENVALRAEVARLTKWRNAAWAWIAAEAEDRGDADAVYPAERQCAAILAMIETE